jgi:transposase
VPGQRRPSRLLADRAYDSRDRRAELRERGIVAVIPGRKARHGSGLGRERWVVERTFAWLHSRRRLLVRTDRRHDIHESFLDLACCQITWRRVETSLS